MPEAKLRCPICSKEFPAYDQRGFRNAGYTSHHNRCLERHQQQADNHQRDPASSRASRFALAIRRRLLPARPSSPTRILTEAQMVHPSPPNVSSRSSSSSSVSSSTSNMGGFSLSDSTSVPIFHPMPPTVRSQLPLSLSSPSSLPGPVQQVSTPTNLTSMSSVTLPPTLSSISSASPLSSSRLYQPQQQQQQQQQAPPAIRHQRHTWNHSHRANSRYRRSEPNIAQTTTTTPTAGVHIATAPATMTSSPVSTESVFRTVRTCRSLSDMDCCPMTDAAGIAATPTFPLLASISSMNVTTNSNEAFVIPQNMSPLAISSSVSSEDGSPFSFTSMLTTLPLGIAPLSPTNVISTSTMQNNDNNNNYSNNDNDNDNDNDRIQQQHIPQQHQGDYQTFFSMSERMANNNNQNLDYYAAMNNDFQQHQCQDYMHQQHPQNQQSTPTDESQQSAIDLFQSHSYQQQPISNMTNDSLQVPLSSLNTDLDQQQEQHLVFFCDYCCFPHGLQEPSCYWLQYIMMNVMGGNNNPSSSSSTN